MNKRGQIITKYMYEILVSVFVIISFVTAGYMYGTLEVYYKSAAAKDIALIINQLNSMQGDFEIKYNVDLKRQGIIIEGNTVKIYTTEYGPEEGTARKYDFTGPAFEKIEIENPKTLTIKKSGGKIIFS